MAQFSAKSINLIKEKLTITDVASLYLPVVRKGGKNWVVCPFHNDKNPSMILNDDKGMYHCFGCGASGSIFNFVMQMDKLTFPEAVERLAQRAGIQLEYVGAKEKKEDDIFKSLRSLNKSLSDEFKMLLESKSVVGADNALFYLKSRQISKAIIDEFSIGYAPNDWDYVKNFLLKSGYSNEVISQSGLFSKERGTSYFVDRIVFPIQNTKGDVVAFSGRKLNQNEEAGPKYINSSNTPLFEKRRELFGFYQSLKELKKGSPLIICEGNFDVLATWNAGIKAVAATCGTALTPEHASLIRRYTTDVRLMFDSDDAGQKATQKALVLLKSSGLTPSVITIQGTKDIAEKFEKEGIDGVRKTVNSFESGFDYLIRIAFKKYNPSSLGGKKSIIDWVFPYIDAEPSYVERSSMLTRLALFLKISENSIEAEFKNQNFQKDNLTDNFQKKNEKTDNLSNVSDLPLFETDFMKKMMFNRHEFFINPAIRELEYSDFTNPKAALLFETLCDAKNRENIDDDDLFIEGIEDDSLKTYLRDLQNKNEIVDKIKLEEEIKQSCAMILKKKKDREIRQLRSTLSLNQNLYDNKETIAYIQRKGREVKKLENYIRGSENAESEE